VIVAGQITHDHGNRYKKVVPDENNLVFTLKEAGIGRAILVGFLR